MTAQNPPREYQPMTNSLVDTSRSRWDRQAAISHWCAAAFGAEHASSVPQRAVRMLEEAIELYQACGGGLAMARDLLDFVFIHPAGSIAQELGGIGVTVLALANAAGLNADLCEENEVDRVLAKPLSYFRQRNEAKNAAGFEVARLPAVPLLPEPGEGDTP